MLDAAMASQAMPLAGSARPVAAPAPPPAGTSTGDVTSPARSPVAATPTGVLSRPLVLSLLKPAPAGTHDARSGAVVANTSANEKSQGSDVDKGVRHDFGSNALRASAWLGLVGGVFNWGRWAAAFPYNKANHTLGLWAYAQVPVIGSGLNNKIIPYEAGNWRTAYMAANTFGTVMTTVHAAVAIPNLAVGFRQGYDSDDTDHSTFSHVMHGFEGIVGTRAGRAGLLGIRGPATLAAIILSAGWHARGEGMLAVLKAGQLSPWRGSFALGMVGVAMEPIFYLNESGSLDFMNVNRAKDDDRSKGTVFMDGVKRIPEAMRSLAMPFVPQSVMPSMLEPDAK